MKDTYFAAVLIAMCFINCGLLCLICIQGKQINDLQEQTAVIKTHEYELKEELKEVVQKCERMTDTCIDIISNERWK